MVTEAPKLAQYKPGLKTIVETDFSDYVGNGVLFQLGKVGLLHLIASFYRNLNLTDCHYKTYDKDLLAII